MIVSNDHPTQPPYKESFQIIYKISPILSIYVTDMKFIKDNYLEETLSDFSEDESSLDNIYFKENPVYNNNDEDIESFDFLNYINQKDEKDTNYSELSNKFWNRICVTLNQIKFGQKFCDPTQDFPNFVKSLYAIKEELDPITKYLHSTSNQRQSFTLVSCLNCIIKLISQYSLNSDPNFIIWYLPEVLQNNNFIYFSLLLELIDTHNSIWSNFSKTPGSLNLFLDHYLPLIGPSNSSTTTLLIIIIDSIFQTPEYYEQIKKPKKHSNNFWFKLMRIIGCSKNDETITTAFYIAKSLFLQLSPLLNLKSRKELLDNLIDASSNGTTNTYREFYKISSDYEQEIVIKNKFHGRFYEKEKKINEKVKNEVFYYRHCPVHYQVLEFIFSLNMPGFKYMTLCKKLINQGIKNPNDLFYIQRCLLIPKTKKPLLGFRFLLNIATGDKIWSSLATKMMYEPLRRFSNFDEVQSLFSQFVKKAFIFIGVTTLRNKYKTRRMMILYTFRDLYKDLEISWLNSTITSYYAALVFSKKIQHIIPEFSLTTTASSKKKDKNKKEKNESKIESKIGSSRNKENRKSKISFNESIESIKPSHSVQSFNSIQDEVESSIHASNSFTEFSEIDQQNCKNSTKNKEKVQYDKNFPMEVDRIAKTQIDMKNYLKFQKIDSKSSSSVFTTAAKTKALNNINVQQKKKMNQNHKLTPQQQKLQMERQKYNERMNLQRKQMLLNFQQQKEKRMPNQPLIKNLNKENNKNLPSNQKAAAQQQQQQQQQNFFLHIKNTPKSQMNQPRKPQNLNPKIPTLIQPSKRQIQQHQQNKMKRMEIQKIEPIDNPIEKCQDDKKIKEEEEDEKEIEKEEEEDEEEEDDIEQNESNATNANDDDDDDDDFNGHFSSDIDDDIEKSNNDTNEDGDDDNDDDDDKFNDNDAESDDFPNSCAKKVKSPNDSPPLSPSSTTSIKSHGSLLVVPIMKRKQHL